MMASSNYLSRVFAGYIILTLILVGLTLLQDGDFHWFGANLRTKPNIKYLIEEKLPVGTPSTEIEKFFTDLNINYNYYSECRGTDCSLLLPHYSGIIRNVAHNPYIIQKVRIRIYVDKTKNFVGAEVSNIYTTW